MLYCVTAFSFFLIGGALAGAMRAELADTGRSAVGPQAYNTLFTVHGIIMIFLFVAPFGVGLANYLVPLQIGAPDMAFPRVNAMSYLVLRRRRPARAAELVRERCRRCGDRLVPLPAAVGAAVLPGRRAPTC